MFDLIGVAEPSYKQIIPEPRYSKPHSCVIFIIVVPCYRETECLKIISPKNTGRILKTQCNISISNIVYCELDNSKHCLGIGQFTVIYFTQLDKCKC